MIKRRLHEDEKRLIRHILGDAAKGKGILARLDDYEVEEMNDGGMGSLRTAQAEKEKRRFGEVLAEAELTDSDGTPVIVSIIADSAGELYEIDMWRVDFLPLKRWPQME
ncbi:MAG: hypothetical protein HY057_07420 [Rhodospirillales bacterium]|nr:hypothetical protein [Rhodospirillales bacterium]